ncbi:MAG: hypothetical protein COV10_04075 [Candidatus Vogelbacteria bacterium CG10_big_fil_rev_8_21_14_0_10_51_16]|uniref:DUF5673 domain-containing protein n=1 Tax=Candidatus Vogelbacteria bacterium CG10_big_fil_rev_8_21_14_0_10_51_16 TaxID=1975045 RepID=A0A2H0RDN6_9BACT|nr:MAG: hypothetical protein COV10_04075 [Candidatus Vogelbacteria bacterium CG10_big_fil_rev_8_21_14_0_10_51_16]
MPPIRSLENTLDRNTVISWHTNGVGHTSRPAGWYVGIIGSASIAALMSAYFGNFLFAILLILSGLVLALLSARGPDTVQYNVSVRGVQIGDQLHPYHNLTSFCIHERDEPLLVLHSKRAFMPVFTIPLPPDAHEHVRHVLLHFLIEENHEIPYSDQMARALGL